MREMCCVRALGTGVHYAQQGQLIADSNRLQTMVQKFRAMKAKGIEIPTFWGHQMKRGGPIHSDDKATQRALWTAGWVHDVQLDPADSNVLEVIFPPPPGMRVDPETKALVDPVKHTQIKEVSLGIGDWKDGTGEWWEDVIVHVALTPLPVWLGQDGIRSYDRCDKLIALSADGNVRLKYVLGGMTMPAAMKAKPMPKPQDDDIDPMDQEVEPDGDEEVSPGEGGGDGEGVGMEGDEGADGAPNEQTEEPDGDEVPNPMDQMVEGGEGDPEANAGGMGEFPLIEQLGQLGITLPDDTNEMNFVDRFSGVVAGLLAAGAKISVGGEQELGPTTAMNKAKTEQPPLFTLSTADATLKDLSPLERALAGKAVEEAREKRRKRCDGLLSKGLPSRIVDRVRLRGTQVNLSLDGDAIRDVMPDMDDQLDLLEAVADEVGPLLLKATLATSDAKPSGTPIPDNMPRRESEIQRPQSYDPDATAREALKRLYGEDGFRMKGK